MSTKIAYILIKVVRLSIQSVNYISNLIYFPIVEICEEIITSNNDVIFFSINNHLDFMVFFSTGKVRRFYNSYSSILYTEKQAWAEHCQPELF